MWPAGSGGAVAAKASVAGCGPGAVTYTVPGWGIAWGIIPGIPRLMRTFSSPSVISSSAMPDCWTRSICVFSLRRSIRSPLPGVLEREGERELVAFRSQPAHDPRRELAEIGLLPERFAGVNVGKMDFDERYRHRRQRIAQGDARMGIGGRIDDDEIDPFGAGLLDAVYQLAFRIALVTREFCRRGTRLLAQSLLDRIQSNSSVTIGLAGTEQIEVRAVDDQNV